MQPIAEPMVVKMLLDLRFHAEEEILSLTGLVLWPVDILETALHSIVDGVQFVWPYVRIAAEESRSQ